MTKPNFGDKVLDRTMNLTQSVMDYIGKEYQNVKPFDKEAIQAREQLFWYDQLQPVDMMLLRVKHGDEKLNEYIYKMGQLKNKTKGGD